MKILELSPIFNRKKTEVGKEAIIEIEGRVLIVNFSETETEGKKDFNMSIITAPSLRHALAFKKQEESFAKSAVMWSKIKP